MKCCKSAEWIRYIASKDHWHYCHYCHRPSYSMAKTCHIVSQFLFCSREWSVCPNKDHHYCHHLGLRRMMSPSRSGPAWIILSPGDLEGDISGVTGRVFFEILQHHRDQYLIRTSTISIVTDVRRIGIFSTMLLLPPFPWSITFIIIIRIIITITLELAPLGPLHSGSWSCFGASSTPLKIIFGT